MSDRGQLVRFPNCHVTVASGLGNLTRGQQTQVFGGKSIFILVYEDKGNAGKSEEVVILLPLVVNGYWREIFSFALLETGYIARLSS